jgi:hypothetical protein
MLLTGLAIVFVTLLRIWPVLVFLVVMLVVLFFLMPDNPK